MAIESNPLPVLCIEDDLPTQELVKINLSFCVTRLTLHQIHSRHEALAMAQQIITGNKLYPLIIIDGNLSPDSKDGQDAKDFIDALGPKRESTTILSISAEDFSDPQHRISLHVGKAGISSLPDIVDEIFQNRVA